MENLPQTQTDILVFSQKRGKERDVMDRGKIKMMKI